MLLAKVALDLRLQTRKWSQVDLAATDAVFVLQRYLCQVAPDHRLAVFSLDDGEFSLGIAGDVVAAADFAISVEKQIYIFTRA